MKGKGLLFVLFGCIFKIMRGLVRWFLVYFWVHFGVFIGVSLTNRTFGDHLDDFSSASFRWFVLSFRFGCACVQVGVRVCKWVLMC